MYERKCRQENHLAAFLERGFFMYPVFLHLKQVPCLVVGAGAVAQRRIFALLEQEANVTVLAPEPIPLPLQHQSLRYIQAVYATSFLKDRKLVFAATNDIQLNQTIVREAQERGILVSSITNGITTDFSVPAHTTTGNLTAAISTNGGSPSLAAAICKEVTPILSAYEPLCSLQVQIREEWKEWIFDARKRKQLLSSLSTPEALACYREQGTAAYLNHIKNPCRTAIVTVSVGTREKKEEEKTIVAIEKQIQIAFPNCDVYSAYSSRIILQKRKEQGEKVHSVTEVLEYLQKAGYQNVYCQPLYLTTGKIDAQLSADVQPFQKVFSIFKIGKPLLESQEAIPAFWNAIQHICSCSDVAYLWMGHGSHLTYQILKDWIQQQGYFNVFLATLKGEPSFDAVLREIQHTNYRKVVLVPLMLVAGWHAQTDMIGAENPNSWEQVLKRYGYQTEAILQGLGADSTIQQLYVERIRALMASNL